MEWESLAASQPVGFALNRLVCEKRISKYKRGICVKRPLRIRCGFPSLALFSIVLLSSAMLCGCSDSGPQRIAVDGTITFAGDPPPADGFIVFSPVRPAEGFHRRPARARFSKGSSNFEVTSVQPGDGLVPGTYHVMIECWSVPPTDETAGKSLIPKNYTPPEIEAKVDGPNPLEITFDIPKVR